MERFIDWLFLLYFASHIPISLMFDSQTVLPRWIFPKPLVDTLDWYTVHLRDPMMAEAPAWYHSFCLCEVFFQFPFFFVATYAFWKGISKCRWVRLPLIIYSTHVMTTVIAILYHVNMHDFTSSKHPAPGTPWERIQLSAIYLPYLTIPTAILLDACFSGVYRHKPKKS